MPAPCPADAWAMVKRNWVGASVVASIVRLRSARWRQMALPRVLLAVAFLTWLL